ncbi:precorrin-4 C11-methyltransferase /cobalt-factor II C20-methyltransferase [Archaeoglobus sulfaticallidus PM70-1]|uniref:Precorrin-4 C11-methyltransferase /cobalt-factor II C20-methyltransferase n=1 Tax=Archaeoglobus sulfaticallidus PM70-1 TaxID=387631 RepID=N0BKA1_9EURY|nr:SAM-dependent methyltransferase [Archaeoglobus sulfaticallidus]AGK60575.1 precorrin-4 C11-methyltransferase /cobalt-factor II C20-methyltransferase [Archaeoglobus sulfaticallidus PM70-1]
MSNKVYFIGFGPGDPELLTVKAFNLLKKADLIIYPGSIIEEESLSQFKGEKISSYGLTLEEIVDIIEKALNEGKLVVRVQSGDPSIYGAIAEQINELKSRGIDVEVIPGVSSVFASSASLGIELTAGCNGVAILRPKGRTLEEDYLEEVAKLPLTIVILLGVAKIDYIVEKVGKIRGFDEPCAVVYHASREDEIKIISSLRNIAEDVRKLGIRRTATIIIGKAVKGSAERSYLYGCFAEGVKG